jgi:hypothetical protein
MGRGKPCVEREHAALHAEPEERKPEQRRQVGALAQGTEVPATRPHRERRKEREQAKGPGVRRRQIQPARSPHRPVLPLERDQEVRAHREQLPADEEVQAVRRQQHEPHRGKEQAHPHPVGRCRAGMARVGPVPAREDRGRPSDDAQERKKERAEPVQGGRGPARPRGQASCATPSPRRRRPREARPQTPPPWRPGSARAIAAGFGGRTQRPRRGKARPAAEAAPPSRCGFPAGRARRGPVSRGGGPRIPPRRHRRGSPPRAGARARGCG